MSQSTMIPAIPGVPTPSEAISGAIEQALMPMNRRSPRVDITMPPHIDRRAEILQMLDQYSATTMQPRLTIDPQAMQTFFSLPPSIGGTYIAPSNDLGREAYQNAAVLSQLAGTTCMTFDVTPSGLPHIEDDAVTKASSFSTIVPSISQVGTASRMRTDQPRVDTIADTPVMKDALVTCASADLPVQAAETTQSGRTIMGMGAEGWTERSTIMDSLTMEFTNPLELNEEDPLQIDIHGCLSRFPSANKWTSKS